MATWIDVGGIDDIQAEDVLGFDLGTRSLAVFRSADDRFYCTDGLCTHERVRLADGFVMGNTVECPKHAAIFDFRTGESIRGPACVDLQTYPVRLEGGRILVEI